MVISVGVSSKAWFLAQSNELLEQEIMDFFAPNTLLLWN
jgi:hypothetical protein